MKVGLSLIVVLSPAECWAEWVLQTYCCILAEAKGLKHPCTDFPHVGLIPAGRCGCGLSAGDPEDAGVRINSLPDIFSYFIELHTHTIFIMSLIPKSGHDYSEAVDFKLCKNFLTTQQFKVGV